MSVELVFTGNGPGELAGWVRPVARAAREVAKQQKVELRTTMALTPSQFASGREPEVIHGWGLFDRILEPAESVKLSLGVGQLITGRSGTVVHLGGDLWFSARLSRKLGLPACVLSETTLVARRHAAFSKVFATSGDVADQLVRSGVPGEKVVVTGDPRVDEVEWARTPHPDPLPQGEREYGERDYVVSFMPSSRDYLFKALVPYFLRIAEQLRQHELRVGFQMIVSQFLSSEVVADARAEAGRAFAGIDVSWIIGEPWTALGHSDLVLTIPGTNTVELAAAGIPFAVIAPEEMLDHLRLEGIVNWMTRIPGLGRALKRTLALRILARQRFVAIPNLRAGRAIAPEWIGRVTIAGVAEELARLLHDAPRRARMAAELRSLYPERGASMRIAERALALAGSLTTSSA